MWVTTICGPLVCSTIVEETAVAVDVDAEKAVSKAATVIFYFAIVCSFLIRYFNIGNNSIFYYIDNYLYYFALFATIFSLGMYFKAFYVQGYFKKDYLN